MLKKWRASLDALAAVEISLFLLGYAAGLIWARYV